MGMQWPSKLEESKDVTGHKSPKTEVREESNHFLGAILNISVLFEWLLLHTLVSA